MNINLFKNLTFIFSIFIPTISVAYTSNCALPDGISIQTKSHLLYICEHDKVVNQFKIALGQNGVGKHSQGDKKTPLGTYTLGSPHRSKQFDTFIPINYPTREQRMAGFSGRDVGIHGPLQSATWLGRMNTAFDWTLGCVAVNGNQDIKQISTWISRHPRTRVHIA